MLFREFFRYPSRYKLPIYFDRLFIPLSTNEYRNSEYSISLHYAFWL